MSLDLDKSAWKRVTFGDVVRNANETVRSLPEAGSDRTIAMEHMTAGELKISRWGSTEDGTTFTRRVKPGQTLFGKRRAYQRKVAYAEFDAICSGDIYTFEADESQILGEFLPFLVQSNEFFEHALGTSAGSLSPRTNWRDLADFAFELPPLDEQKRIADLLWAADRHRQTLLFEAAVLRGISIKVVEQAVRDDWPLERVDVLGDVQLGQQRHPKYSEGPAMRPYLRVANVGDNQLWLDDVFEMDFSSRGAEKFCLQPGDILLNEGQSLELVGRCAMFRGEIENCYIQKTLLRFRPGPRLVGDFALAWFRYCFYTGRFQALAKRTTSMAHLTAVRFAAMPLPCPPRQQQDAIVEGIASVESGLAALKQQAKSVRQLQDAALAAVFGGA